MYMIVQQILSIIFFLFVSYGLGALLCKRINFEKTQERYVMQTGAGIALFVVLLSLFGVLRIPLYWQLFLAISMIGIYFEHKSVSYKVPIKKSTVFFLIAFLIFLFSFYMYTKGAFSYPHLEDDDPWGHAQAVSYVTEEKSILEPIEGRQIFQYLDAYPPAFDGILGVVNQISSSVSWTLKFFNALFISLSLLFLYFLAEHITKKSSIALASTFIASMTPAYFSHFIWGHSLALMLFPLSLYYLVRSKENKEFIPAASVCGAAIFVTSIDEALKLMLFLAAYLVFFTIFEKKLSLNTVLVGFLIVIIATVSWWGFMLYKYETLSNLRKVGFGEGEEGAYHPSIKIKPIGVLGSATRQHGVYTIRDFFLIDISKSIFSPKEFFLVDSVNMINVPLGIGFASMILIIVGAIFLIYGNEKKSTKYLLLTWLAIAFLGIHGGTRWWQPFALFPFRFWIIFGMIASIVGGYGIVSLINAAKSKNVRIIIAILLVFSIFYTSGLHKFSLNTQFWAPGVGFFGDQGFLQDKYAGFVSLKNIPSTKIFATSEGGSYYVLGLDHKSCDWCNEVIEFRSQLPNKSPAEISQWLKKNEYEYIIYDNEYYTYQDPNGKQKINELIESGLFGVAYTQENIVILKV